jgi:hypothetical protein
MHIGEILNGVFDHEVSWRPSSGSIKPVHVANGFVRALTGQQFDVERLHQFVVWWKHGKRPDEERSYDALVREDPTYASIAGSSGAFDRARRFLGGLLNADSGLYPAAAMSDMTLTCVQMASRSGNDRGLGNFGAALLRAGAGSRALADAVVRAAATDKPEDPITVAVWPLLATDGKKVKVTSNRLSALECPHNAQFVRALQEAATDLATHEVAQGNRLRTLERVVQFTCVAPLVHAQALGANGDPAARIPLLLAMGGALSDEVTTASELSMRLVYEAFEEWLADRLADRIARREPLDGESSVLECSSDGREVRRIFRGIGSAEKEHPAPDEETLESRMAAFQEARLEFGREEPSKVLGHALVSAYLQEYSSGGPREFLGGLSRRVGLIYPHFQGRGTRRLRPSTAVLDMLVRACVPSGQSVSLPTFLGRLWERFGLLTGGHRSEAWDDVVALHNHGITIDAAALDENTEMLVTQLEAMGLARRYADNVTFVGDADAV